MARGTPLAAVAGLAGLMLGGAARAADLEAGRAVVVGATPAWTAPCFTCHDLDGDGDSAGAFPRLTGQAAFYMYKQLVDYASGKRPNKVMSPIAQQLTEPQMADVAYYYSVLDAPFAARPAVDPALLERGSKLAEEGLDEAGVEACNLCHGRNGTGDPPLFPYLAGQYAPYTELQLQLWQEGVRANDALGVMAEIARALSEEEIRAVALYYEWLRPDTGDSEGGARVGVRERDRAGG